MELKTVKLDMTPPRFGICHEHKETMHNHGHAYVIRHMYIYEIDKGFNIGAYADCNFEYLKQYMTAEEIKDTLCFYKNVKNLSFVSDETEHLYQRMRNSMELLENILVEAIVEKERIKEGNMSESESLNLLDSASEGLGKAISEHISQQYLETEATEAYQNLTEALDENKTYRPSVIMPSTEVYRKGKRVVLRLEMYDDVKLLFCKEKEDEFMIIEEDFFNKKIHREDFIRHEMNKHISRLDVRKWKKEPVKVRHVPQEELNEDALINVFGDKAKAIASVPIIGSVLQMCARLKHDKLESENSKQFDLTKWADEFTNCLTTEDKFHQALTSLRTGLKEEFSKVGIDIDNADSEKLGKEIEEHVKKVLDSNTVPTKYEVTAVTDDLEKGPHFIIRYQPKKDI